jgi:hypothetical protein
VLRWICRISLEPDSCVRRTENVFLKYGMNSLLVSKFVPGLNAVAAPLAGSSAASYLQFLPFDIAGAALWSGTYLALGYIFAQQVETVVGYASRMGSWLLLLVGALFGGWVVWKFVQRKRFLHKLNVARITPQELRDMLDAGEAPFIVDVRGGRDDAPSPVPGAVRIAFEELTARRTEIPRDRDIILFCT